MINYYNSPNLTNLHDGQELILPIEISIFCSENKLKVWESQAIVLAWNGVYKYIGIIGFFYFIGIEEMLISIFILVLTVLLFLIRLFKQLKKISMYQPNNFFNKKINFLYQPILVVCIDKIILRSFIDNKDEIIYFDHIKSIHTNFLTQSGITIITNKNSCKILNFNDNIFLLNRNNLINLTEFGHMLIEIYQKRPKIVKYVKLNSDNMRDKKIKLST